jgi:hypothetical protein
LTTIATTIIKVPTTTKEPTMTKAQEKAARILEDKRIAFVKKVQRLTGHLVGQRMNIAAANEAFTAGVTADAYAAQIASMEPVGKALHPSKVEAIQHANAEARKIIERVRADLEKNDWNIKIAAPTSRDCWAHDYKSKQAKRNLYSSLTRDVDYYKQPGIVAMNDQDCARFIANAETDAALQYDMFICKMVAKVGDVTNATIEGTHVWGYSFLTVTKTDGTKEVWKTQQITNYSVYGLPYLQWPSRVVK